jgi:hypothetical protein
MKELADRIPKAVRNKCLVFVKVEIFCPFLNGVLVTALTILLVFD